MLAKEVAARRAIGGRHGGGSSVGGRGEEDEEDEEEWLATFKASLAREKALPEEKRAELRRERREKDEREKERVRKLVAEVGQGKREREEARVRRIKMEEEQREEERRLEEVRAREEDVFRGGSGGYKRRFLENLVAFLDGCVGKEKEKVQAAGYGRERVVFWEGCKGNAFKREIMGRLDSLVAGRERKWNRGYYIGSTMRVVERWQGFYSKDGRWVRGHRHRWTAKEDGPGAEMANMEVLAINEGIVGGQLETEAILRWYGGQGCCNKKANAGGTVGDHEAVNFLYFIWW